MNLKIQKVRIGMRYGSEEEDAVSTAIEMFQDDI